MHNQQLDLSQALAAQRMTERHDQAAQARLGRGPGRLRRRRRSRASRWWQLVRRPAGQPSAGS
jgi:hypothetical protein